MGDTYSTYEAKARFSELLRKVREGRTVTITYHGKAVAEMRPLDPEGGTAARLEWLRRRGVVVPGEGSETAWKPLARRPGALERFLEERHG